MSVEALLDRLDKVRAASPGNWLACCPAHDDKRPSMTVRALDDGRVLVHCFGGCSVESILGAIGMEFDALFPPKPLGDHVPRERRPFDAASVLEAITTETMIVAVASANIRHGETLTDANHERLFIAAERIFEARALANGER